LLQLKAAWERWDRELPPIPQDARVHKLYSHEEMAIPTYG
jgi:hypothetical protein